MQIKPFFDINTATFSYIIIDESSKSCAIIDSVLDYDLHSGKTSTDSAAKIVDFITTHNLKTEWILETHIHADHLSAANYLKETLGGKTAIGSNIVKILPFWTALFNTAADTPLDGSQFDHLLHDEEVIQIGNLSLKTLHTPGHTPSCSCYLIEDSVFVGDLLLAPRIGTARADFPNGSANELFHSIQKIYALPESTKILTCHDYPQSGHEPEHHSTVGGHKELNAILNGKTTEDQFVKVRNERDSKLGVPKLLIPAIQVNLRAGRFGEADSNGTHYIKVPLNKF